MKTNKTTLASAIALILMLGCTEKADDKEALITAPEKQQPVAEEAEVKRVKVVAEYDMAAPVAQSRSKQAMLTLHASPVGGIPGKDAPVFTEDRDNYQETPSNGVHQVSHSPLSTFSIDVDTGSYANVRSYLNMGRKPPSNAIREEAFINYFDYQYAAPEN